MQGQSETIPFEKNQSIGMYLSIFRREFGIGYARVTPAWKVASLLRGFARSHAQVRAQCGSVGGAFTPQHSRPSHVGAILGVSPGARKFAFVCALARAAGLQRCDKQPSKTSLVCLGVLLCRMHCCADLRAHMRKSARNAAPMGGAFTPQLSRPSMLVPFWACR